VQIKNIVFITFLLSILCIQGFAQLFSPSRKDKKPNKRTTLGYAVAQKSLKHENPNYEKLHNKAVEIENHSKLECPGKVPRKPNKLELPEQQRNVKANLIRSSASVHFDLIELEDVRLDIPAFKLFKNNMTDFTADGENEFKDIIKKINQFLGKNHEGKGVTLKIVGSASQIPTSFDPDLPDNNINPNGSSIPGRTSVQNNKRLAKARADELAHKIKTIFPRIIIEAPTLEEIELGKMPWTKEVQKALNAAAMRGDKEEVARIYEPFQKDQWVKVESKDRTSRTVQPESIKMYLVSTTPYLKIKENDAETEIKSVFIVSKNTFDAIGDHHLFGNVAARDQYLRKIGVKVFAEDKGETKRYYLLKGSEETAAFHIADKNERIYALYKFGIVDNMDEQILEEKIIADVKKIGVNK